MVNELKINLIDQKVTCYGLVSKNVCNKMIVTSNNSVSVKRFYTKITAHNKAHQLEQKCM